MSGAVYPWAAGVTRAMPIAPRTVMVCMGDPFSPIVGTAVEEYFLGAMRAGVKVLCTDGTEMRVPPYFVCEDADISNVTILRPRRRP